MDFGSPEKTRQRIEEMCMVADENRFSQSRAATRCGRHKTFHSLSGILGNIVVGSGLVVSLLAESVPVVALWLAGSVALFSALCGGINTVCQFEAREARHDSAARRLASFAASCKMTMAAFEDGLIHSDEFHARANQHSQDFVLLQMDIPRVGSSDEGTLGHATTHNNPSTATEAHRVIRGGRR